MKKRLVSLVAAAALLGSVSLASAGTVTTKGDTNISIGGFIQTYFDWANNQTNLGYQANPEYTAPGKKNTPAQTSFGTSTQFSRISLGLSNPTEGITGVVEGDFWGGGAGQQLHGKGNFELRHAYIVKEFCQEGCNYTPWLLIGQTWDPLEMLNSFTLNSIVGIAGQNYGEGVVRTSQIGFGVKFDLGSVKLNPGIYAANLAGDSTFTNSYLVATAYHLSNPTQYTLSQRLISPGFAFKLPVEFNTGFGSPASAYAGFEWQPMKLTNAPAGIDNENENAWMATVGLTLPVYFVNLTGNFHYERGMTAFDMPLFGSTYTMPSFYIDSPGSVQAVRGTSWNAQAQIDFNKLAQVPVTFAFGYGQTVFSNYGELADGMTPLVRKMGTMFANVNYNLTKSFALGLEYDRNRTYYVGAGNDGGSAQNGNQVFLRGMYSF
ncbi:hypothetical protein [Desulfurella multipotens]|uniref:hypothetical protein n=1 Tax=Desulfurella multipotens TaxID=79269 RepID=UPI000CB8CF4A|nr:hypothetical protein [Desulfurella multipotens]PMP68581.1 MAG: hypothetical protein C0192_01620 [Desulfurella multipotens]